MHPIKDATIDDKKDEIINFISIHAPYKGCNVHKICCIIIFFVFQSMHPIKDATL